VKNIETQFIHVVIFTIVSWVYLLASTDCICIDSVLELEEVKN